MKTKYRWPLNTLGVRDGNHPYSRKSEYNFTGGFCSLGSVSVDSMNLMCHCSVFEITRPTKWALRHWHTIFKAPECYNFPWKGAITWDPERHKLPNWVSAHISPAWVPHSSVTVLTVCNHWVRTGKLQKGQNTESTPRNLLKKRKKKHK